MQKISESLIEVRYAETDQMGVVHHGVYPQYFEIGRVAWLNQFGLHYQKMEEQGIFLPVYHLDIRYKSSAKFGDVLKVETQLLNQPDTRIQFGYKIYNSANLKLLTEGSTTLIFVDGKKNRPMRCPDFLLEKFGFK